MLHVGRQQDKGKLRRGQVSQGTAYNGNFVGASTLDSTQGYENQFF